MAAEDPVVCSLCSQGLNTPCTAAHEGPAGQDLGLPEVGVRVSASQPSPRAALGSQMSLGRELARRRLHCLKLTPSVGLAVAFSSAASTATWPGREHRGGGARTEAPQGLVKGHGSHERGHRSGEVRAALALLCPILPLR